MKWITTFLSCLLITSPLYGIQNRDAQAILQHIRSLQSRRIKPPSYNATISGANRRPAPPPLVLTTPDQTTKKTIKSLFLGTFLTSFFYMVSKTLHLI